MAGVMIGGKRLSLKKRRELGITRQGVRRILKGMAKSGELVVSANSNEELYEVGGVFCSKQVPDLAVDVAFALVARNRDAYCKVAAPGRDWESFFDALIAFIERVLPLIMQSMVL